jgi:GNAT superfamily N-acetyltransferase
MSIIVTVANEEHLHYAEIICQYMQEAAAQRGTGIARRSPDYLRLKIREGKAVIAFDGKEVIGFCYIETWSHEKYVANSGLIVHPDYRGKGLGKMIKKEVYKLSRKKYPEARLFGITTSLAVMKINAELGYKPVTFSELTTDEAFWNGCQSCKNYDILTRTNRSHCLCTGMMLDPANIKKEEPVPDKEQRWQRFKRFLSVNHWKARKKITNTLKAITL